YFLKAWESALKEHCDFKGQVPTRAEHTNGSYWDWTMDWMDLAASSIWNNETGFGGDGEPESPLVVGGGRCVTDGPFSHLRPIRYNRTYVEHCLARGFKTTDTSGRPLGPWFGPESIGKLMRSPSYREFEWEMENRLHNRIHRAVSGDFLAFADGNGEMNDPPPLIQSSTCITRKLIISGGNGSRKTRRHDYISMKGNTPARFDWKRYFAGYSSIRRVHGRCFGLACYGHAEQILMLSILSAWDIYQRNMGTSILLLGRKLANLRSLP
ncbi:unnamed protein product, partial [Colletotrichum noveboracense]